MIKPSDILKRPQVLMSGLGLIADSLCCLFTATRYRSHLHEKVLYMGEPQADEFEWIETVAPVSTYSYANRDRVYRTSRTHSRLPFVWLAFAQLADGLVGVISLGLIHSALATELQFSAYWVDATQPWFRIDSAIAVNRNAEIPVLNYIGVEKA